MRIKSSKILLLDEILQVIADLEERGETSINAKTNKIVFRLSCCCGLRASEICGLVLDDLVLEGARPVIQIRKENTKQHRGKHLDREVPLWWDAGTLDDLKEWMALRLHQGAAGTDPFVCGQSRGYVKHAAGKKLDRVLAGRRWKTALKVLGVSRQKTNQHTLWTAFLLLTCNECRSINQRSPGCCWP